MKALLDTNIIIHRESSRIINRDIGTLFKWLDKGKYTKCIHPVTIDEIKKNSNKVTTDTFKVKLDSYEKLKTVAPMSGNVQSVSVKLDTTTNDKNDTLLLNEVYCNRVDLLITEDKKIHKKTELLGIGDKIFTIDSFLEKVLSENPDLIDYKVLSVTKKYFGDINLKDTFFDSFREDYDGFDKWFNGKSNEIAYVTYHKNSILSFLYLKIESPEENYSDINPVLKPCKRLKIGTFKVVSNGVRLGERFLKIIFDNALVNKVDEIYVTIFDKRDDEIRLISLFREWGFLPYGKKTSSIGEELVFVRNFKSNYDRINPKMTYPFFSKNTNIYLIPIYPDYHTELLPDSILKTESPEDFIENEPHRNAISKVYITRSLNRDVKTGDILIFYRTAEDGKSGYYNSVITTIGLVENKIEKIADEQDFILKCRKRSIFSDSKLKGYWNFNPRLRPFIINFLYIYSFSKGKRMNRKRLLDLGILTGDKNEIRGLKKISKEQFNTIIRETQTNESIIVD